MAEQRPPNTGASSLKGLGLVSQTRKCGAPPLHRWNPPYCGEIDIRIAADGTWFHQGAPIGRPALVRLFASILIGEDDGRFYLVTPVEKVGIKVEDAPFQAVALAVENRRQPGQTLVLTTNIGDEVAVGPNHPLSFRTDGPGAGFKPYVLVRAGLKARVARAITYDLVELAEAETIDGEEMFGVRSGGVFFAMCPAGEVMV